MGVLLATLVALHSASIPKPFFADDYLFLEQVRGKSLLAALVSPDPLGNFLRPVGRQGYFWVVGRLGAESPVAFHVAALLGLLAIVLCLYLLLRRLVGRGPALLGVAYYSLHYATDVPVQWASGSQDILAVLFALMTLLLHTSRARLLAPLTLALALLSKESVAGTVFVAMAADHALGQRWSTAVRRAGGLMALSFAWGVWWLMASRARPASAEALSLDASNVLAAIAHLVQVAAACEFRLGGAPLGHWRLSALFPAIIAGAVVWLASRATIAEPALLGESRSPSPKGHSTSVGMVWVVTALAPIMFVAPIWSAYFYLWALCGVALLLGRALMLLWRPVRMLVLAGVVFLSANARMLDEFALSAQPWAWQSHVNYRYIDRSLQTVARFLKEMKSALPTLPPRSTVFFANVPSFSGWQAGNGPLLRWAYRDTSLRSYYLNSFSREKLERGPVFFLAVEDGSLRDRTSDSQLLPSFALSMMLAEHPRPALDALTLALAARPHDVQLLYWRGLLHRAVAERALADQDLRQAGIAPDSMMRSDSVADLARATDYRERVSCLLGIRARAGYNPWVHARLAATYLDGKQIFEGTLEAYAARILAPTDPDAWRKWAAAQLANRQWAPALASLRRYTALADSAGNADREAQAVIESLEKVVHGEVAQRAMRVNPTGQQRE